MFEKIKFLFKPESSVDYGQLIKDGAIIVDVRSKGEYESGHVKAL